jgi:hypothetical protein
MVIGVELPPIERFARTFRACCSVQDPLPEQVEARAALNLPLVHQESVDLGLGLAVAPGLSEGRPHGSIVLSETCGEGIEPLNL